jgi:uncharacterized membrane protein HdeD (DUF308 family)
MQRILERSLVVAGALLCIGGAIGFWQAQLSSPTGALWPLPALVLIEWMLLGVVGAIAAFRDHQSDRSRWATLRWVICGGLFGLSILGVFSIGPLVLCAALTFLGAAMLADQRYHRRLRRVGVLIAGTVGNMAVLLLLVGLAHT